MTAWTSCRPPTPGPASRWRCGTCSARRAGSRSGACSAIAQPCKKMPYASLLFGDTPEETLDRGRSAPAPRAFARRSSAGGRSAAAASRPIATISPPRAKGSARTAILLVDVGQIFGEDVEPAAARLPALEAARAAGWRSRSRPAPMRPMAALAPRASTVKLAGGEGAHNVAHGAAPDGLRQGRLYPDRLRPHRRHRPGQGGGRSTRWRRASPTSTTLSPAIWRSAPRCSPMRASPTTHLRISGGAQAAGIRPHRESPGARPQRRDRGARMRRASASRSICRGLRPYVVDTEIRVNGKVLYQTPSARLSEGGV